MRTLLALCATALACALARPPGPMTNAPDDLMPAPQQDRLPNPMDLPRDFLMAYIIPHVMERSYVNENTPKKTILDREIDVVNQMDEIQQAEPRPYKPAYAPWERADLPTQNQGHVLDPIFTEEQMYPDQKTVKFMPPFTDYEGKFMRKKAVNTQEYQGSNNDKNTEKSDTANTGDKKSFAMTPLEDGFFQDDKADEIVTPKQDQVQGEKEVVEELINARETRQNPNLSRTKNLISENLDKLRAGFTPGDAEGTQKPHLIHIVETSAPEHKDSIYSIALIVAVGTGTVLAVAALAFGWYTYAKKAKAAADVDYPAYGVTGPNMDISGDKKLAHSAHMYHYQHQKQQIIAMERNDVELGGSVSDPESDEENEEGDYTVYECPGFATTGDMEVKNPLFKEVGTPATPADGGEQVKREE